MSPRSKLSSYVGKVYTSHNDQIIPSRSQYRRSSSFSECPQPSASERSQRGFDNSRSYKGKSSGYDSSSKASHGSIQRSRPSASLLKPTSRSSTPNRIPSTDARVSRRKSYSDVSHASREPSPSLECPPTHKNSGSGSGSSSAGWDFADKGRRRKLKRKAKYGKRKAPQKEKIAPAPRRNRERPASGNFGGKKEVVEEKGTGDRSVDASSSSYTVNYKGVMRVSASRNYCGKKKWTGAH